MHCRSPGPHPGGKLRGLAWGGLQAHTQGEVEGSGLGGLQAHTQGGLQTHTQGGIPVCTEADTSPADGYCYGQYTSYWNAFLFYFDIWCITFMYASQECIPVGCILPAH